MASLRQIRGRIKSIQSSKQIMRAMQLVSASKLKRTQDKMLQGRVVMEFLDGLLARVLAATAASEAEARAKRRKKKALSHPLATPRETGEDILVVITSDTGLCGSYNANLIAMAEAYLRRDGQQKTPLVFIGKRGHRYFTKRGFAAVDAYLDLGGRPNPAKSEAIGRALMDRFLSGQARSVNVLYSRYMSATTYRPTVQPWLPIQLEGLTAPSSTEAAGGKGRSQASVAGAAHEVHAEAGAHRVSVAHAAATHEPRAKKTGVVRAPDEYILEPSPEAVFQDLLPRWTMAKFHLILLEAFTSEHSARMVAMKSATDNAEELLSELTLLRNRIRQAAITKELSEIVGTVEALK
jgi:F-type H+-transporting ATPase subunit gamma